MIYYVLADIKQISAVLYGKSCPARRGVGNLYDQKSHFWPIDKNKNLSGAAKHI